MTSDYPAHFPKAGSIIADNYVVERPLGQGGMAYVVAARHKTLDRVVAIKCMLTHLTSNREAVERFLREARIASSLTNEHVVRVTDVGLDRTGTPFMTMELLEGETLESALDTTKRLPFERAIRYTLDVCEALEEAHAKGIVHRDLKPSNLFLVGAAGRATHLKILDFGISKVLDDEVSLTGDGTYMGSPHYTAPEQLVSTKQVDKRADIWSVGVCFYRYVSGVRPFEAETVWDVARKVLNETPTPVEVLRPDTPKELAAIIRKCLERNVESRFACIEDLKTALERVRLPARESEIDTPPDSRTLLDLQVPPTLADEDTRLGPPMFPMPNERLFPSPPTKKDGSSSGTYGPVASEDVEGSAARRKAGFIALAVFGAVVSTGAVLLFSGASPVPREERTQGTNEVETDPAQTEMQTPLATPSVSVAAPKASTPAVAHSTGKVIGKVSTSLTVPDKVPDRVPDKAQSDTHKRVWPPETR